MKSIIFLFCITVSLISSTCFSQDINLVKGKSEKAVSWAYQKYDINNDDILTKEEVLGTDIHKWFKAHDYNKDGVIDIEEFRKNKYNFLLKQAINKKVEKITKSAYKVLDKNKDGLLSKKEVAKDDIHKWFDSAYDFNKDGVIDKKEFRKNKLDYLTSIKFNSKNIKQTVFRVKRPKYVPKVRYNYEKKSVDELFRKFDTNTNGKIERNEAKTENSFNTDFSRMDSNGDEELTKKELTKYLKEK